MLLLIPRIPVRAFRDRLLGAVALLSRTGVWIWILVYFHRDPSVYSEYSSGSKCNIQNIHRETGSATSTTARAGMYMNVVLREPYAYMCRSVCMINRYTCMIICVLVTCVQCCIYLIVCAWLNTVCVITLRCMMWHDTTGHDARVHPVSITRFPLRRFLPGAGLLRNPFVHR